MSKKKAKPTRNEFVWFADDIGLQRAARSKDVRTVMDRKISPDINLNAPLLPPPRRLPPKKERLLAALLFIAALLGFVIWAVLRSLL